MSLTALDPKTALIVVDLQQGIIGSPFIHPIADVIAQTGSLIDAFRRRHLPVVLVNVAGGAPGRTEQPRRHQTLPEGWADLIPELGRQPSDILVTKRTWGAFASTDLEARLKAMAVTQVVITGVATGTGVLVNVAGGAPGRTEQPRRHQTLPEGWADLIPELGRQPSDILEVSDD